MPDFLFLMESRLAPEQVAVVQRLEHLAAERDLNLFLVGGALRDMLCGHPIRDLDFAVEGNALKLLRAVEKLPGVEVREMDRQRQSAELIFPGEVTVELAQCRSERYTKVGAEPKIAPGNIHMDLRRRDFSMNAIGLSLNRASRGLVLDPNNGVGDIERREIRSLHNYSFADDPTRLLRLVRFRSRLHFALDPKTATQFHWAKERELLQHALPGRLRKELYEITQELRPCEILKALDKEEMTRVFHSKLSGRRLNLPEVLRMEKTARWLDEHGLRASLYGPCVFYLTRRLSSRDYATLVRRLKMKRAATEPWMKLEARGKQLVRRLASKEANAPSKAFQLLSAQPAELLLFVLLYFPQRKVQDKLKGYISRHRPLKEKLPEKELQALGVAPETPAYGRILNSLFTALLDGKVKSRTEQLKYLKKLAADAKR